MRIDHNSANDSLALTEAAPGRREALKKIAGMAAAVSLCLPPCVLAQPPDFWSMPRTIWLRRQSTGEEIREVYWSDGKLNPDAYAKICVLLRDVSANQAVTMDLRLLDILYGVQGWLAANKIVQPLITTSGYRNRRTNGNTEGAAQNSKHPEGKAWDGHIAGVSSSSLARFGAYLSGGGVGFYQSKGVVHLDSGTVRQWRG